MADIRMYTGREFDCRVYNGYFFSLAHLNTEFLLEVINQRCVRCDGTACTPLMYAAYRGDHKIVRFLLENGANYARDNNISVCLAAASGHLKTVKLLVEYGADVTVRNNYPICKAIYWRRYRVVKYLLNLNVYPTEVIRAIVEHSPGNYKGKLERLLNTYVRDFTCATVSTTKAIRN